MRPLRFIEVFDSPYGHIDGRAKRQYTNVACVANFDLKYREGGRDVQYHKEYSMVLYEWIEDYWWELYTMVGGCWYSPIFHNQVDAAKWLEDNFGEYLP